MVITMAAADLAQNVNVGHKVHFDTPLAFALAMLATSAGNVERKASSLIAALARLRQHGVKVADMREDARIGCGIGAWSSANGRLINADDLINVFGAGNCLV